MPDPTVRYSGLALPAVRVAGGYFSTKRTYDVAWGDLIIAIHCPRGGRVMRRSFGSDLPSLLMAPLDATLINDVQAAVVDAVRTFCPHIRLVSVIAKRSNYSISLNHVNANTMDLSIAFTIAGDRTQTDERMIQLDRRSIMNVVSAFRLRQSTGT